MQFVRIVISRAVDYWEKPILQVLTIRTRVRIAKLTKVNYADATSIWF